MPIYEYESIRPETGCPRCRRRFEVLQSLSEAPIEHCPDCGAEVRKVISWCRGAVVETNPEHVRVERQVSEYEREGMWSHAAELADKHAEKTKDSKMLHRALDNYEKAGYAPNSLEKHAHSLDQ